MINSELIAILQQLPPELEVKTEGCDCYGVASGAEIVKKEKNSYEAESTYILIGRVQ